MNSAKPNRLIRETSPYLLQHAHNPVDWYPWGDEAFERAAKDDKPVFLSIGYSTCHWCHVMERESFADPETAGLLNGAFVCIKVDREERPDIDQYFMAVCQAMTGSGGWPLTILMTPEKKPFFAGTYFPKARRFGLPGLRDLVPRIQDLWASRRDAIFRTAENITAAVLSECGPESRQDKLTPSLLDDAYHQLADDFDERHGGFGSAPKFPSPHNLSFLLRTWKRTGREAALAMVEKTLLAMSQGGIADHLGYGFHRYSTDARWLVPHFEKMLYDQALLALVFNEAYLATGKAIYKVTAFRTLDYVLRDLTTAEGAFASAEDADSEGEEGKFYVWTLEEVETVLGPEETAKAAELFNLAPEGNFAEAGRPRDGRNILHLANPPETTSSGMQTIPGLAEETLDRVREKLFLARGKRPRPFKDTKVLADWNGLALSALARTGRISGGEEYLRAAEKAAHVLLDRMRDPEGRLFHVFTEGEARIPGFLDDYAFVIQGLVDLYETTFRPAYLEKALALITMARRLFEDKKNGGFFFVPPDSDLPLRKKEIGDGAHPSGNAVMAMNFLRLGRMTGKEGLEEAAARMAASFSARVASAPRAYTAFLCALDFAFGPAREVVVTGPREDTRTQALIEALRKLYLPNTVVLFKPIDEKSPGIVTIAPFTESMTGVDGRPAAYVCSRGRCLNPVETPEELKTLLAEEESAPA